MGKKDNNLQVSCEDEDIQLLDTLRGHFEFFHPKRSELARVLLRYAMTKVRYNPRLLKDIARLFENANIADIEAIEGYPATDIQTERRAQQCVALTGCSYVEARAEFERAGAELLERNLYASLRQRAAIQTEENRMVG